MVFLSVNAGVGVVMIRHKILLIICSLLLIAQVLFAAPWSIGYRVALDGYHAQQFSSEDYMQFSAVYEPFQDSTLRPSINAGVAFPLDAEDSYHTALSIGMESALFVWHDHPFQHLFRRDSALMPRWNVSLLLDVQTISLTTATIMVHPFSFHFGDKYISIVSPALVKDVSQKRWGWALRLFEITHYIW